MKFSRLAALRGAGVPNVDFDNDIINDVVIVQEGEAKGHGVLLDKKFISDIVFEGNSVGAIKSRFGHPNMCGNSLGDYIGTYSNFRERQNGDIYQAIANLSLDRVVADKSPKYDKSLVDYILSFAANKPDMFGNSIVFSGKQEQREFTDKDGEVKKANFMVLNKGGFNASDVVDDPAATSGMFSELNIAGIVTEFVQTSEIDIREFDELLNNEAFSKFAEMLLTNPKISHRILNIILNNKDLVNEFKEKIRKPIDLNRVIEMFNK